MDCTNSKSVLKRVSIALIIFMIFTLTSGYQNSFADNIASSNTNAVKVTAHFTTNKIRDGFYTSLVVDYNILDRSNINPGDTITIKLPDVCKDIKPIYKTEHFSNCTVNGDTVTLTFGSNINKGVQGYFTLQMYGNSSVENKPYEAVVTVGNQVAKANIEGQVVESGGSNPDMYKVFGSGFPINNLGEGVVVDRNDPVPYSIVVNRNRKNLGVMNLKDTIPTGMALDPSSLEIDEVSSNNVYTNITSSYLNSGRVHVDYEGLQIAFDPGNMYMVKYNTFVTSTENKYDNKATMTDYYGDVNSKAVAILGSGAGAINVYKTVSKDTLSNFGNQDITYHIKFDSFGTFLKGTMHIKDKINPKLTDIKVTSTNQFTVKYDSSTKVLEAVNDKSTIEPGSKAEITINASMKNVVPGETITNTAQVNGGNTNTVYTKKDPLIQLSKVGVDNPDKLLRGAEFKVINTDNNERVNNIVTENGQTDTLITSSSPIKFELPNGNYKLVEIKAPNGYAINSNPINFSVNSNSTTINLTANDNPVGNIKIVKTNNLKDPLKGAKFNLVQDGKVIQTGETNSQGILQFNNVEVGNYQVVEVSAPKGYQIAKDTSVTVNKDETSIVNVTDQNILGTLNITKIGNDGAKLEGAEFTVTGANGYKQVVTTDTSGVATLNNIPWGTYIVKEIKAPIGYKLSGKEQTITIDANNVSNVQNLTFNDSKILGNLVITKTNESGNALSGAEFTVTGSNGYKKAVTTDKSGVATLNNIPWGTYTVQETKAPEGYKINSTVQTVVVSKFTVGQPQNLTFKDSKMLGNLAITKVGNDGVKLNGAAFTVTGPDGFNKVITTDKGGVAKLYNLNWGTYTIKEIEAPEGYKLNEEIQTVTIGATTVEKQQNVTIVDGQELGNLVITKEGPNKEKLSGATFEITGPNNFDKTVVTGNDGIISVNGLYWGTYNVKEIKAPQGYNLDKTPQTIEINSSNVKDTQSLVFKDSQKTGTLNITKIGNDGAKLEGAEFTVTGANGYKQVAITDKSGVATLNNIPWGTYTVKETKAPIGYKLSGKKQAITIDANNVSNVQNLTFNDTKILGNLVITKTNENGNTLSGAEFKVTGPNGFKKEVTTDSKGIANLDNLEWGTYTIKETKAPEGYTLNSTAQTVEVSKFTVGQPQNLTFKDSKMLGNLAITKVGNDGAKLSGAEFTVTGPNGFNRVITTDKGGVVKLDNLNWGTYTIKEIEAPEGYKLNEEIQTVTIGATTVEKQQNVTIVDGQELGNLVITKEGPNKEKLSGATFEITGPNNFDKTVVTGNDGTISVNGLAWGTYNVKEIKAPQGYNIDKTPQTIEINSSNVKDTQSLVFKDSQKTGTLNITKIGNDGAKLEGAEFTVTGANGYKQIVTTDKSGVATLNNITWGTYTVKETKAPIGYALSGKEQTITIDANNVSNVQNLTFNDTKILGNLVITKTNENGNTLSGAEFTVTGPNGFKKEVTTNSKGIANLDNLEWGTYTVQETKAPEGYTLNSTAQTVVVNKFTVGQPQNLTFKDSQKIGTLNITKVGNDGAKLSGAEFTVTGPNGFNKVITTDKDGVAKLDNLPWGTYTIKETKAPEGYKLNEEIQTVIIGATTVENPQNVTIVDGQELGNLVITKEGPNKEKLSGATFEITGPNNFDKTVVTGNDGTISVNGLSWGTYNVKEIKAPKGYNLDKTPQTVEINSSNVKDTQSLVFKDSQKTGTLNITKIGNDGAKLEGAEFTVTGANGYKQVVTTDKSGVATLNNIPWGTYTVKETKAPIGYKLSGKKQAITIDANNVSNVQNLTFNDIKILGNLVITKTNENGNTLSGAEFTVTGPNGFKKEVTTDSKGIANLDNLEWGTYTIKETKAPEGYTLNSTAQTVVVSKFTVGQPQNLTFKDSKMLGNLAITKVGHDGAKLSGAEFTVTGPNGFNKVITTDKDGVAKLDNLSWGTYTIKETKAPEGYKLNEEIQTVIIGATTGENPQNVTIVDGQELGNLVITKEGPNKEKLAGATFEITGPNNFDKTVVTGNDGTISVNGLAWGTYNVKEIKAPQGYNIDKTPQTVEINSSNVKATQSLVFKDSQKTGTLNITKIGNGGAKLEGAEFTVTGANGYKQVVTTDTSGVATLNNIPWGTYTVKETKAPIGYKLSGKKQAITIDANNVSNVQNLTFNDTKILGNLVITKTNENGNALSGAEFTVTGPNGFKKEVTTNSKGIANLDNLEWGTYTVQETKAPEGYTLNSTAQTVVVSKFTVGQPQNLTFKDSQKIGTLNITKVGNDGAKLSGAEFTVTGPNGFNKVITTDKDGVAKLDNLPWGTYTIKETKAPEGYKLNEEIQTVIIGATTVENPQNVTIVDGQELGNLVITKEGPNKEKLSGATFEITGPNNFDKTVVTGNDGTISVNGLSWGTYNVKEIKAPKGYNLDKTPQTIEINSSNVKDTQSLVFKDSQKTGTLNITKIGNDEAKLEGAEFTVTGANGYKQVVTTDKSGVATLNNIPWGTYTVKETKAPIGYALSGKEQTITIDANNVSNVQNLTFNDIKILGNLVITKTNESGNALSGAEFTVTGPNGFKKEVTTDSKGIANLDNLEWGTYTVQETKAPEGYTLNSTAQTVVVSKFTVGQPQNLTFKDSKMLGNLAITKVGNDGAKLSGAEFTITGPNGFNKVITTDKDGVANLDNLIWGTYTIKETKAPEGYKLNEEIQTVTIGATTVENPQNVTIVDGQELGNLVITKEGPNKEKLSGATFEITGPNNFDKTVVTGNDGIISVNGLAWGTYNVKEIKAPQGYNIDKTPQTVEINSSNVKDTQSLVFKDSQKTGTLNITKIGNDGAKLEGAEFTVTGANGYKQVAITDKSGVATLNNIPWGTYTVKETKAPIGYKLSGKKQAITIDANNVSNVQNLTFNDTKILGNLVITKTNENGNALSGAEFKVTGPNGFKKEVTTDSKGIANLDNLEWGTYTVQETKAPEGYTLNSTAQTVEVSKFTVGQPQNLTFKDSQKIGTLNITKIGNDGAKLEGAEFTVTGANGYKQVVTTDKSGVATLNNIPWGTYTVKETKAPIGYKLSGKKQAITIDANNVSNVQNLTFNDTKILGNLVITKTNESGNALSGAEFKVTGPNGFKKEVTTDSKGIANLDNLEWGTYTVQETKAPEGYTLNSTAQTVVLSKFTVGQPQNLTFKDSKMLGNLAITKVGNDGAKLSGAEFTVTGPNGFNKVITTDKDGVAKLDNLSWGIYTIKETKAPKGYKLDNKVQVIKIDSENAAEIQKVVVKDEPIENITVPEKDNTDNSNDSTNNNLNNDHKENHDKKDQNYESSNTSTTNPLTGDNSQMAVVLVLFVAVIILLVLNKKKFKKVKK